MVNIPSNICFLRTFEIDDNYGPDPERHRILEGKESVFWDKINLRKFSSNIYYGHDYDNSCMEFAKVKDLSPDSAKVDELYTLTLHKCLKYPEVVTDHGEKDNQRKNIYCGLKQF